MGGLLDFLMPASRLFWLSFHVRGKIGITIFESDPVLSPKTERHVTINLQPDDGGTATLKPAIAARRRARGAPEEAAGQILEGCAR